MDAINKHAILRKTHYGLNIYAHILQHYYPGTTVLSVSGRTCAPARNPFNNHKYTLMIKVEGNIATHHDTQNAIPPGDVFQFAGKHYNLSGIQLLKHLNEELNLRIKEKAQKQDWVGLTTDSVNFNHNQAQQPIKISLFKAPVTNTKPCKEITLRETYNLIAGTKYKTITCRLRSITSSKEARLFKAANFDYCTFSGTFTTRNDKNLIRHSGLLAVDFDHLPDITATRNKLLNDPYFETQLLFTSPSGDGLKWIIPIDIKDISHSLYFNAVANYIKQTYKLNIDKSGRDISRACFLPHDPTAFINHKHL